MIDQIQLFMCTLSARDRTISYTRFLEDAKEPSELLCQLSSDGRLAFPTPGKVDSPPEILEIPK